MDGISTGMYKRRLVNYNNRSQDKEGGLEMDGISTGMYRRRQVNYSNRSQDEEGGLEMDAISTGMYKRRLVNYSNRSLELGRWSGHGCNLYRYVQEEAGKLQQQISRARKVVWTWMQSLQVCTRGGW